MTLIDRDTFVFKLGVLLGSRGDTDLLKEIIDIIAEQPEYKQDLKWHMFPEEKPRLDGRYLVTSPTEDFGRRVYIRYYRWGTFYNCSVDAWAELPAPFTKIDERIEEKDDD